MKENVKYVVEIMCMMSFVTCLNVVIVDQCVFLYKKTEYVKI